MQIFRNVKLQNAGDQLNQQNSNCQFPKSFQSVESYKDCLENSGSASEGSYKVCMILLLTSSYSIEFSSKSNT